MKITKLQVHPQGPLIQEFKLSPLGLNLIYGKNESGKTYVLEALGSWLFGSGRSSPLRGKVRNWMPVPSGSVEVAGIDPETPEASYTFDPVSKRNLQDELINIPGFSPDFIQLFFVKAGENLIESPESLVKNCLSGSGILEELISTKRISKTIQAAIFKNKTIEGKNQGELSKRLELEQKLNQLIDLREKYFSEIGSEVHAVDQELAELQSELIKINEAKKAFASKLFEQREKYLKEASRIKMLNLDDLKQQLISRQQIEDRVKEGELQLKELDKDLENKPWLESAIGRFRELSALRSVKADEKRGGLNLLPILSLLGIAAALASFFYDQLFISISLGVIGVTVFFVWLFYRFRKLTPVLENHELEKLQDDYGQKFGTLKPDEHEMQSKLNELIRLQGQKDQVADDLSRLNSELTKIDASLKTRFSKLFPEALPDQWAAKIKDLEKNFQDSQREAQDLLRELDRLGFEEPPICTDEKLSEVWDAEQFEVLQSRIEELKTMENQANSNTGKLRTEISAATGVVADSWEELIGALEREIDVTNIDYREITALIMGKMAVTSAVRVLQQQQDEMIIKSLSHHEIYQDLCEVSGNHFTKYSWENSSLGVVDESGQSYPLDLLSTGAMEQVSLSLRILFARTILGPKTGFLLLDDAFQHSDWNRREKLVDFVINLVNVHKWQIFYFTMDNHLTQLFHQRANELIPDNFSYSDLSRN